MGLGWRGSNEIDSMGIILAGEIQYRAVLFIEMRQKIFREIVDIILQFGKW